MRHRWQWFFILLCFLFISLAASMLSPADSATPTISSYRETTATYYDSLPMIISTRQLDHGKVKRVIKDQSR